MTPGQIERLIKRLSIGFVVLAALVIGIALLVKYRMQWREEAIVNDVQPLIDTCMGKPSSDGRIPIRGRVLLWDMRTHARSPGHDLLPSDLQASGSDAEITVFMIVSERAVPNFDPEEGKRPSYRPCVEVCVAYWPQKEAAGMYVVPGRELPFGLDMVLKVDRSDDSSKGIAIKPEQGEAGLLAARWINTLPRSD